MKEAAETAAAEMFADLRPRLIRLAYRMLGSVADAEDVVHDAWLRWLAADRDLDHQVVEGRRAQARQHVHLRRLSTWKTPLESARDSIA